jgi:hypothetical protein
MTQDQLANHTGCNSHQQVVTTVLHPLLATWRLLKAMTAPIIDYVVVRAVLRGYAASLDPIVLRTSAHFFGLPRRHAMGVALRLSMRTGAGHGRTRSRLLVLRPTVAGAMCTTLALLTLVALVTLRPTMARLCECTE